MKSTLLGKLYQHIINPPAHQDISSAINQHNQFLPTLWLLGKTGAGKSSVVQKLTQQTSVEVGNGFSPCTRTAHHYDFPAINPVMRFLDTRGLAEAEYDPSDDLKEAQHTSHAVLVIMRVDDTDQTSLLHAINSIHAVSPATPFLAVHTALHEINKQQDLDRTIATNQYNLEVALQRTIPSVSIDFTQPEDGIYPDDRGLGNLKEAIVSLMPELHLLHTKNMATDTESRLFEKLKYEVYWYAGVAAASDTLPAVGLVTVPSIQGKMLHSLAQYYGVVWTKRYAAELLGALGASFLYRYGLSLGGRQLGKLIPVYGQSAGAVAAASVSFVTTVALGRAASRYLYAKSTDKPINADEIKEVYRRAMQEGASRDD